MKYWETEFEDECTITELPRIMCAHCLGHTLGDEEKEKPVTFAGLLNYKKEKSND